MPLFGNKVFMIKKVVLVIHLCLIVTIAHQAPPLMGFSRQEYWSGLPFPSPGDLSNPGMELRSPSLQVDFLPSEPAGSPGSLQR